MVVTESLTGVTVAGLDLSGQDLRGANLSNSTFHNCNFDRTNLADSNCENSDFLGSTFRRTILTRTNFKGARLGATVFQPEDAYGITITLQCSTFMNMKVSQLWWYCWLMFLSQMIPDRTPVPDKLDDKLLSLIGAWRYVKLKNLFARRQM